MQNTFIQKKMLLGLTCIASYCMGISLSYADLFDNEQFYNPFLHGPDANFVKSDNGTKYLQNSAPDSNIAHLINIFYSNSTCDNAGFLASQATSPGGLSFRSGTSYYVDANALFTSAAALTAPGLVASIEIKISNTDETQSIFYCIPSATCNAGTAACTSSTRNTLIATAGDWTALFPA